jgi:hypothetical protein
LSQPSAAPRNVAQAFAHRLVEPHLSPHLLLPPTSSFTHKVNQSAIRTQLITRPFILSREILRIRPAHDKLVGPSLLREGREPKRKRKDERMKECTEGDCSLVRAHQSVRVRSV